MITMRFEGGKELAEALRRLPTEALERSTLRAALTEAAEPIVVEMKARAPRKTGEGAASITTQVVPVQGYEATVAVGPDRDHFYLAFPEWGTAKMPARPWARPAWDAKSGEALHRLGSALWERLARTARRLASKAGA